MFMTYLMSNKR